MLRQEDSYSLMRWNVPATVPQNYHVANAWHAKPDALTGLTPPWENARIIERTGSIEQPGSRVKIRLRVGPFFQTWTAEHTGCEPAQ
jgi:ligand-binding SRPBCC domain-containing protein